MVPLEVTATLSAALANPTRLPDLDGLLAAAVCLSEGRDPPDPGEPLPRVEIPVALSPCGRYHLASRGQGAIEQQERGRFVNRRFPMAEAQALAGPKLTRIVLAGGPCKSFRIPLERALLANDRITWWALGDPARVRWLLAWITHLGKRRAVGNGAVVRWEVRELGAAELWEGFPVLREGLPLRNLPLDAPGVDDAHAREGYACVMFPYWEREREERCWTP